MFYMLSTVWWTGFMRYGKWLYARVHSSSHMIILNLWVAIGVQCSDRLWDTAHKVSDSQVSCVLTNAISVQHSGDLVVDIWEHLLKTVRHHFTSSAVTFKVCPRYHMWVYCTIIMLFLTFHKFWKIKYSGSEWLVVWAYLLNHSTIIVLQYGNTVS